MATGAPSRRVIAASVVGAALFGVVFAQVGLALPAREEWQHALSHVGPGIAAVFLIVVSHATWPARADQKPNRVARTVLVAGLAVFAVGQLVEAVGAFGYRGYGRVSNLSRLHDVGVLVGAGGLLVALAGVASSLFIAVAGRRGPVKPRTLTVAVLAALALVVAYVVAGIVFGF